MEVIDEQNDADEWKWLEMEEQNAELNSIDGVDNLFIHHGPSGGHTPVAMDSDFDIMQYIDPALSTALDAEEAKNAAHYRISQTDFNLNQMESLRSEIEWQQAQFSDLLKNLNHPATTQQQPVGHFETAEKSPRMQPKDADGEVVIASNPTPPCDHDDQSNAQEFESMLSWSYDPEGILELLDGKVSPDTEHHHQLLEPPPTISDTVLEVTFNRMLQGEREIQVSSNDGEERAHLVEDPFALHCSTQLESVKTHSKTHSIRPFTCNLCSKSFAQNNELTVHYRTHTGERPFTCKVCNKSFKDHTSLSKHYRIHTGKKPFPCKVCGKSFTQSNGLKRHLRIHIDERPFKCNMCSKSFTQNNDLALHYRMHTGERPFKCNMCSKSFTQNVYLKKHLRTHTDADSLVEIGVWPSNQHRQHYQLPNEI